MFKKLSKYDNLFLEQESMELYALMSGEMKRVDMVEKIMAEDDPIEDLKVRVYDQTELKSTLRTSVNQSMEDRLAAMDAKVESGEISCNLDNPEDCINCGS